MPTDLSHLSEQYLMYFIVPLWLAVGVADWLIHRRAGIEHNAGPKESMLHWQQFTALLGIGAENADFSLRWKESPLPRYYVVWLMAAIVLFELLPYGEEFLRTLRGRYQRKVQRAA